MTIDKMVDEGTPEQRFNDAVILRALKGPVKILAYADLVSREKGVGDFVVNRRYVSGDDTFVQKECHYGREDLPRIVDDMSGDLRNILDGSFEAKYEGREGEAYEFRIWTTLEFRKGLVEFERGIRKKGYLR